MNVYRTLNAKTHHKFRQKGRQAKVDSDKKIAPQKRVSRQKYGAN